jgi:F-type H+-transporting ATPase subunit delta
MNESKISVRYAKALFALAKEAGSLDILRNDVEFLYQCIREIPELDFVIHNPVIKTSEKVRLFAEAFEKNLSKTAFSFVRLVIEHRREEYFAGISRYFLSLLKTEQGIQPAEIITAVRLDESLRKSVVQLISKKFNARVELQEETDQSLIGGFILRVGDQQVDASIASKLKHIQNELIN